MSLLTIAGCAVLLFCAGFALVGTSRMLVDIWVNTLPDRTRGLIQRAVARRPDYVIGGTEDPYLRRWWIIPRNPIFNVYLHQFLRSDDDRALHDHPWMNCSIVLRGCYLEHRINAGGVQMQDLVLAGEWRFRWTGRIAHRIELTDGPCWTLFITGPRYRSWGFHCPRGWVHWKEFTADDDRGAVGRGCER